MTKDLRIFISFMFRKASSGTTYHFEYLLGLYRRSTKMIQQNSIKLKIWPSENENLGTLTETEKVTVGVHAERTTE